MANELKSTMTVKGFGSADGSYECDIGALVNIGEPGALDSREQHKVRLVAGVRGGEIQDAVAGLDAAVMVALTGIVLARNGKTVLDERIWNSRIAYATTDDPLNIDDVKEIIVFEVVAVVEEDTESPPKVAPLPTEQPSTSGGASSKPTSDPPANGQSLTGRPGSLRSVTSDLVTSET